MRTKFIQKNKKYLVPAILLFNTVVCVASLTVAWFVNDDSHMSVNSGASISAKSYFESGDGSEDDPYIIAHPRQFYFFAWLQNMGIFNQKDGDTNNYTQYYFELSTTIDMEGYNLPPVGTTEYPFIGSFEGNGNTIKKLNVTNNDVENNTLCYTDEPERKDGEDRHYQIMGVFGVVGPYGNMGSLSYNTSTISVKNLVLEDITVNSSTPKDSQTLMGIAAGYVYDDPSDTVATISNIKVSGTSTLTSAATSSLSPLTSKLSDYALVGYTNKSETRHLSNVEMKAPRISYAPTESGSSAIVQDETVAGGDLVIAPCGLANGKTGNDKIILYNNFGSNLGNGASREVDKAIPLPDNPDRKSAYYYGSITSSTPTPTPSNFVIYNGNDTIDFDGAKKTFDINTTNSQSVDSYVSSDESFQTFIHYKDSANYRDLSSFRGLYCSSAVNYDNIAGPNDYPANCIWFKPMNAGHCFVSFGVENMSKSAYKSLYRYKRDAQGRVTDKQELVFCFSKQNHLGNGTIVLFDINVTDTSYEYCIGNSTTEGNSAYFFFLKLAGTDAQGGPAIAQGVAGSQFAVYEQTDITTDSLSGLTGVEFVGDVANTFQLNTINSSYQFTAEDYTPTSCYSTGSYNQQTQTNTGSIQIQTITGLSDTGETTITLKKITANRVISFYSKLPSESAFQESTEAALGRYFIPESPFPILVASGIQYHEAIASSDDAIYPTTSFTVNVTGNALIINSIALATEAAPEDITVDLIAQTGFSLSFTAGNTQIYPQA